MTSEVPLIDEDVSLLAVQDLSKLVSVFVIYCHHSLSRLERRGT